MSDYSAHKDNVSMKCFPPHTPLLYSKNGVYRGIHILLFLVKNIDCGYSLKPPDKPTINLLSKNLKTSKFFAEHFIFYNLKNVYA